MSAIERQIPPGIMRRYTPDAEAFVMDAWLRSFGKSPFARDIKGQQYFKNERRVIERLLQGAHTMVLTPDDNADQFQGFLNFWVQAPMIIVNYMYVKDVYRGMGYGSLMLSELIKNTAIDKPELINTYETQDFRKFRKRLKFSYNPYLVRKP